MFPLFGAWCPGVSFPPGLCSGGLVPAGFASRKTLGLLPSRKTLGLLYQFLLGML
ncbi:unnamed protein product [Arabidopsis halleri]